MFSKLILAASALAFATSALSAPLEARNPGSAYCAPFNLAKNERVSISADTAGKESWNRRTPNTPAPVSLTSFFVGESDKANSTNTFLISENLVDEKQYFKFETRHFNNTRYCISDFSRGAEIRDAPCTSDLTDWKLTCRSCGYDGHADTCHIESRVHGTCANIVEPLKVDPQYGLIDLAKCQELGVGPGSTEPGNQVWNIVPKKLSK
ncbi:hypothetical protein JCM16303_003020 [Sporobolomyces ruberrimus]